MASPPTAHLPLVFLLLAAAPFASRAQTAPDPAPLACGLRDVGGHFLRHCDGGSGPVTVVFEADLGEPSDAWRLVAPGVTDVARVVVYDRAGLGGSEAGPTPRTSETIARELRALLRELDEEGPFVLVGHGAGGLHVRAFAALFPDDVGAALLIETPHPRFEARRRSILSPRQLLARDSMIAARGEPEGTRLEHQGVETTPPELWHRPLPRVPWLVLSASRHEWGPVTDAQARRLEGAWRELQQELAGLVPGGEYRVIEDTGPELPLAHPDTVIAMVGELLGRVAERREVVFSDPEPPPDYPRALELLEAGDTTAALVQLRAITREHPRFGLGWLTYGSVLSTQSGYVERRFPARRVAQDALDRALMLMGGDPRVLVAYGLLFVRQHKRTDARRMLERAWIQAERRGAVLPTALGARLHYELAQIYEAWWEDWQNLVSLPDLAPGIRCTEVEEVPTAEQSATEVPTACPSAWWERSEYAVPLADLKSEERERMLGHYLLAVRHDPGHVDAAVRLLGHLADGGAWELYEEIALQLLQAAPEDPRAHLFRGLGLHERGRSAEAAVHFQRGLALLPPEERRVYDDIRLLIPRGVQPRYAALDSAGRAVTAQLLFQGKDPVLLSGTGERRLEHIARLVWADLKFGEPEGERRGWETDRGEIWIRYGPPVRWYQCCYGGGSRRTVTWSYGPQGPIFTFGKTLGYRRVKLGENAKVLADELQQLAPEVYRPRTITAVHEIPHQVVRFRGSEPSLTRVEYYAAPPAESLFVAPGALLESGFFLFSQDYEPLWEHRGTVAREQDRPFGLTVRLELPPGAFRYGLEARLAAPDSITRPVARARGRVEVSRFPETALAISDMLYAHVITPRTDAPATRADLAIVPVRAAAVPTLDSIAMFFEIYNLAADSSGLARYSVELSLRASGGGGVLPTVLDLGRAILGREQGGTSVQWRREAPVVDGRTIEYFTMDFSALPEAREYTLLIAVEELRTGRRAVVARPLAVAR